jgi:hypothetical protein
VIYLYMDRLSRFLRRLRGGEPLMTPAPVPSGD